MPSLLSSFDKLRVFLSSTFTEFKKERTLLYESLKDSGYDPWEPESEGSVGAMSNAERCLRRIEGSDAMVCLLGADYGSPHPASVSGESIVEWEYGQAREIRDDEGRPEIFVWIKKAVDDGTNVPVDEQEVFLRRIKHFTEGVAYDTFSNKKDLKRKVRRALGKWTAQIVVAVRTAQLESESFRKSQLGAMVTSLSLCLVAAIGAITALILHSRFNPVPGFEPWSMRWRIGVPVCAFAVSLAGYVRYRLLKPTSFEND